MDITTKKTISHWSQFHNLVTSCHKITMQYLSKFLMISWILEIWNANLSAEWTNRCASTCLNAQGTVNVKKTDNANVIKSSEEQTVLIKQICSISFLKIWQLKVHNGCTSLMSKMKKMKNGKWIYNQVFLHLLCILRWVKMRIQLNSQMIFHLRIFYQDRILL